MGPQVSVYDPAAFNVRPVLQLCMLINICFKILQLDQSMGSSEGTSHCPYDLPLPDCFCFLEAPSSLDTVSPGLLLGSGPLLSRGSYSCQRPVPPDHSIDWDIIAFSPGQLSNRWMTYLSPFDRSIVVPQHRDRPGIVHPGLVPSIQSGCPGGPDPPQVFLLDPLPRFLVVWE